MVSKRSSDEARQAAREARKRTEKRKRYEALLEEHPAVKAVQTRIVQRAEKVPIKRGVPKMIAAAMEDKDIAEAVPAIRRVMKYHHRTGDLIRRRLKSERISLRDQIALIRQGENIEHDFQQAVRLSCKAARATPETFAYVTAIASVPDDDQVTDDPRSFMSRSEKAVIRYLGISPEEFFQRWEVEYPRFRPRIRELAASGELDGRLKQLERSASQLQFLESPRHLVKRDIITLGGDGGGAGDIITGGFLVVIGAVMVVTSVAVLIEGIVTLNPSTIASGVGAGAVGVGFVSLGVEYIEQGITKLEAERA